MTSEDFEQLFQTLNDVRPFRPFTVELNGGHLIEVDFPGSLALRDGFAVYLKPGGGFMAFDHESVNRVINDLADTPDASAGNEG
jgi:hypothetical protein